MNAGQFKHPITIWREVKSVNDYGETICGEFQQVCKTRAQVITDTQERNTENDNIDYTLRKKFRVHLYVDVREYDQIKYNNKTYRILTIDESEVWQDKEITTESIL